MKALIIAPQLKGEFFDQARDAVADLFQSLSGGNSTVHSFAGRAGVATFSATPRAYDLLVLALPASVRLLALHDTDFHKELACGIPLVALCEDLKDVPGQVGPVAKHAVSFCTPTIAEMSDPACQSRIAGMIGDWTARRALPRAPLGGCYSESKPVLPPANKVESRRLVLRKGNIFQIV